jgi:hypothetical protein
MSMGNPNPSPSTRFKPGESGNPKGRPKGTLTLTEVLRQLGEIEDVEIRKGQPKIARKEALGHKMWNMALSGKADIARYIYDRLDGKPTQEIKVQSDAAIDAPIVLHVGATITVVEDEADDDNEDDRSTD